MVRNSSVGSSHMSGLIGSKRSVNSVAPAPYVGPTNKRLNVGSSSNVNRRTNPTRIISFDNNPVMRQPNPQPINTTRVNNPYGYRTNNNGHVAQNYPNNGLVMPVEGGYANPFSGQSSIYRGVTRYPGHFEAVVWDNFGADGKPERVYLGSYYREADAARAFDLAALKLYGVYSRLNFPLSNYGNEVELMKYIPKSEYLVAIRRMSLCYQGDRTSCYNGVSRVPGTQKWQATLPNPNATGSIIHLGAFESENDAARAYDFAIIKIQGSAAITNFSLAGYNIAAIRNSNYILVGSGGARCVTLQTGANNAVTCTPSNQWVTQNGVNNAVTWTPSNQMNRHQEPQNPSFSYNPQQSTPTLGANNRRNAEPVLNQNPNFSIDQSNLGLDASRCTGGLEDMIRGYNFGGNCDEPVSGQNPTRWKLEEIKKFLEIETDENIDSNKQFKGENPSQLPGTTTTTTAATPLNEFIKDMAEFIKADPKETFSLESEITNLPLDESNYCGGAEDQKKTLFEEIDELFNLDSGDEPVLRTEEPGSLPDMSDFDLLPIDEISQLDWDDVASDDWLDVGELPSPSNNIEIQKEGG